MTIRSYQYAVSVLVTPASSGVDIEETVAQSLGVTDEAVGGFDIEETVTQSLGVTDSVVKSVAKSVDDLLEVVDFASYTQEKFDGYAMLDDLGITDVATSLLNPESEDFLGITDEAIGELAELAQDVDQGAGITDAVEFGYLIRNLTVAQDLGVEDSIRRAFPVSADNTLNLTDAGRFTSIEQDLGVTDLGEWGYGYDIEQDLSLSDLVEVDKILNPVFEQDLNVVQAAAWFIESRCARYQFKQFHGEGGVAPIDQPLNYSNTFLLQSIDDGTILVLRNPETDDRRRVAFNRVNRSFFDGTADIYAADNWVVEETQIYTIVATKRSDLDALHTFLLDNLGREILVKDWVGITWKVIITNPGEVYTEDGEGYWTIDFEVTGDQLEGEYALNIYDLTDVESREGSIWVRSGTDAGILTDKPRAEPNVQQDVGLSDSATNTITP